MSSSAGMGHLEIVRELLEGDYDLTIYQEVREEAADSAAVMGCQDVVDFLRQGLQTS